MHLVGVIDIKGATVKENKPQYIYKLDEVDGLLERAIKAGYPPMLFINGEYYEVK